MTQPAANPLSTSEPWDLVADGYAEFWDNMVKGSAPIQMMKTGLGEALWREKGKLALAWLEEILPTLRGAADFGCVVGDGGEVMARKNPWTVADCSPDRMWIPGKSQRKIEAMRYES